MKTFDSIASLSFVEDISDAVFRVSMSAPLAD